MQMDQKDLKKQRIFNLGTVMDPYLPATTTPSIFSSEYFKFLKTKFTNSFTKFKNFFILRSNSAANFKYTKFPKEIAVPIYQNVQKHFYSGDLTKLKRVCTLHGFTEKKKLVKSKNFKPKEWKLESIDEAKVFHISVIKLEELKKYISQVTVQLKSKQSLNGKIAEFEEFLVFEKNILDKLDDWKFVSKLEKDKIYTIPTTQELYNNQ